MELQIPEVKICKAKKLITDIPQQYYFNPLLNQAIGILPPNYNFEIPKTLHKIATLHSQLLKQQQTLKVSLQFPQGLMLFACILADIFKTFSKVPVDLMIMGDVTYGACCVDDLANQELNYHLLVHYGHSCLIPITQTKGKVLYIFVEIQVDVQHFIQTILYNFQNKHDTYYLMGTIQFNSAIYQAKNSLINYGYNNIIVPQQKPRSGGEVLGCTSPVLPLLQNKNNIVIFLCDGRFHMEAAMIANPSFTFYQYDPYTRNITQQRYDNQLMRQRRSIQIERSKNAKLGRICIILGTLGRQGSIGILDRIISKIQNKIQYMVLMASEINEQLLKILEVDYFVQIACPRLSIDWSYLTPKPLLTPFQFYAMIDNYNINIHYSMDYYSNNGGQWSNFYGKNQPRKKVLPKKPLTMEQN